MVTSTNVEVRRLTFCSTEFRRVVFRCRSVCTMKYDEIEKVAPQYNVVKASAISKEVQMFLLNFLCSVSIEQTTATADNGTTRFGASCLFRSRLL